ncbi:MAG TPA: CBS domain-containing protein [Desulfobacterales bacterium]|nr:CBS domain-containing protein [Desulfobacterales bacterium]HJO63137.1 CBS domain-containing protein [Desulfobacterales bacterium]
MHLVKKAESIPEDMPFLEFKKLFSETKQHYFPVTASNERFIGIFPSNDIRSVLFSAETEHLVVMKDIGTSKIIASTPADDRNSVLKNLP